jgi:hypothetical protein
MTFPGPSRQKIAVVNKTKVIWQNTQIEEKMAPARMDPRVPLTRKIRCDLEERRQGELALPVNGHI